MAVIKDVARMAGVSISTVSKYFNNPSRLSESYKARVEAAVNALDYTPNNIARGLRTKRTNIIALIVPDITNSFYVEMYNNIRLSAMRLGYITQLYTSDQNNNVLSELLGQFSRSNIDGIILGFLDEDEIIAELDEAQKNTPIALVSWDMNEHFSSVVLKLPEIIYSITDYFIKNGHTRIAYVNGTLHSRISLEKLSGYKKAMYNAGLPICDNYIYEGGYLFRTGYQAASSFMMLPEPPTAIVAANDILAIGCCKYLQSHGYRIPDDVAVGGMDGVQLSRIYDPSITTMAIPLEAMCNEVVDFLVSKIERPGSFNRQTVFEAKLVIGRSTDASAPLRLDF